MAQHGDGTSYSKNKYRQQLDNLPDPIFVTDNKGNVLLSNSATAYSLDMSLGQLLKSNVADLVKEGYYNFSNVMTAVINKEAVSGMVITNIGMEYISMSTPVLDKEGKVQLVITTGRPVNERQHKASGNKKKLDEQQKREIDYLRSYVFSEDSVIAENKAMQKILITADTVAQTDSTVLLYGETGTGKDVLAKYIHKHSKRHSKAFIAANCATLNESLIESELFGYEKGAFTGAASQGKTGLFAAADGGTLFLDEVAELPLTLQAKLLRVLETSAIRRIGSNTEQNVDFRLIVSTHRDLKKMVDEEIFRYDLYYRLNVMPIFIPPLRERPEDIITLAIKFVEMFNQKYRTDFQLDTEMLESFRQYSWPGNVRELRNIIERNVIVNLNQYNDEHLSVLPQAPGKDFLQFDYIKLQGLNGPLKEVMKKVEERYIRHALNETGGKVGKAAEKLGIYRTVLYRKLKEYDKAKKQKQEQNGNYNQPEAEKEN